MKRLISVLALVVVLGTLPKTVDAYEIKKTYQCQVKKRQVKKRQVKKHASRPPRASLSGAVFNAWLCICRT